MTNTLFPRVVWEFVAATNARDLAWLETLFVERCTVSACGYRAAGLASVVAWLETEFVVPCLSLVLIDVAHDECTTNLSVRVIDHEAAYDSALEFHTMGRYIRTLEIIGVPRVYAWPTPSVAVQLSR